MFFSYRLDQAQREVKSFVFVFVGLLVGFLAAIPLGPVNVFVISQTIRRDFLHGLLGGLTTACLDFVYCLVALVGFFHMTINLTKVLPYMKIVAGFILFGIGITLVRHSKTLLVAGPAQKSPAAAKPILGVLLLYVSNPSLYFFWLAVGGAMTAHRLVANRGWIPIIFSLAVGLGSLLWYFVLVRYVAKHHGHIHPRTFQRIFLVMAIVLMGFAAYTFLSLFL